MNKRDIGSKLPSQHRKNTWVQTERAAHEAWNKLISEAPMAARLAHILVANMGQGNVVVASQRTLGELMRVKANERPVHRNTVRKALIKLEDEKWIQTVQIGGKGGALAYVINDRVAWGQEREGMRYSRFSAQVLASSSEQTKPIDEKTPLRQIPVLMRGEEQLPSGKGLEPPSQPSIDGLEPPLPERADHPNPWAGLTEEEIALERGKIFQAGLDAIERQELENKGQQRLLDDNE